MYNRSLSTKINLQKLGVILPILTINPNKPSTSDLLNTDLG
ncbi:MAG: hypothetical protein NWE87_03005 [Candidatus Bathyarchaeota archaeon]|nr:hypothetical protein [Candidatus Bathyarchaeota archaeon]